MCSSNHTPRNYKSSELTLETLYLESLKERREILCLQFAKKCIGHAKMKNMFQTNKKTDQMEISFPENYALNHANTERLKNLL